MVFSSTIFLFAFLPAFLALYFICPGRVAKNTWLLLASLVFYARGEPVYVVLMVASIAANWLFGLMVGRKNASEGDCWQRRIWLIVSVVFNLAVIGFFKYEGFLATNVNALLGSELVPDLELPLPIGISFYMLQALSYVIDVYRGEVAPQRNPLYLGMYVACFPQLIAGPIVRYQTIQDQVVGRRETLEAFASGARLFTVGLAKKVLLANTAAILASKMLSMGGPHIGAVGAWAGLLAYTFQIFFDFSGYSDVAIGLGRMMGFEYLRNFNYPYISRSITDFWWRWHMSLSSFFRDYVYIPLGGSRCSKARNAFNIAIVWTISGLWHGAAWNYVGWGAYYGALLLCEKFVWGRALGKAPAVVQHLYTIAIFVFGWSFFWITDPAQLVPYWKAMLGRYGATGTSTMWELTAWEYWPLLIACILASTPIAPWLKERVTAWTEGRRARSVLAPGGAAHPKSLEAAPLMRWDAEPTTPARARALLVVRFVVDLLLLVLLVESSAAVVSGGFNPFIYFQF